MKYKVGQVVKVKGHKFTEAIVDVIYNDEKMLVHIPEAYCYAVINVKEIEK